MDSINPTTPTNSSGQEAINTNRQQGYVVGDGTTDRVLVGFLKNGFGTGSDYGIKVSQSGSDVKTASDDDLIMSSEFNMFKISLSGTTSVATPSTMSAKQVVTATVNHNLGYAPAFLAYVSVPNLGAGFAGVNALQNMPFTLFSYNITPLIYVFAAATTTTLTLNVANLYDTSLAGVEATWTFRYYIMQETAATT